MRRIVVAVLLGASVATVILAGTARGERAAQTGGTPSPTSTLPPPGAPPTVNTPVFQPPPPPNATNTPTLTPTSTPTPTATATPVPLTLKVQLAHATVAPGSIQKVTVITLSGAAVNFSVNFPNGDSRRASRSGNPSGHYGWSYKQPGSRITRGNRTATVSVRATSAIQSKTSTKRYTIGFGAVDVVIQPRAAKRPGSVVLWLHSSAFTKVSVFMRFSNGAPVVVRSRTGSGGWAYESYHIPSTASKGSVSVRAFARGHSSATSFRVL